MTFSGKKTLCEPKFLNPPDAILSEVNECLEMCNFEGVEAAPEVPEHLNFRPPIQMVKEMASEIGMMLQRVADNGEDSPDEIVGAFISHDFDYSNDLPVLKDDPDMSNSMWAFVRSSMPNVDMPKHELPANDLLYSILVMSTKTRPSLIKQCLHQWIIIPGSMTMTALADAITCPLCALSLEYSGAHKFPRYIETQEKSVFDFNGGFEVSVASCFTRINCASRFHSGGGCTHILICGGVYPVHLDSLEGFPAEIGGKKANPPYCRNCNVRPGPICVRKLDSEFEFYCKTCMNSQHFDSNTFIVDLTTSFFTPN